MRGPALLSRQLSLFLPCHKSYPLSSKKKKKKKKKKNKQKRKKKKKKKKKNSNEQGIKTKFQSDFKIDSSFGTDKIQLVPV